LDGFEWYKAGGEVYRAPLDGVFENGYRMGRWEFPEWQIAQRQKAGGYPFGKTNPVGFGSPDIKPSKFRKMQDQVEALEAKEAATKSPMKRIAIRQKIRGIIAKMPKVNPASAAAEVFEEFHGHAPGETVTVRKEVHTHEHLASAGKLIALHVQPVLRTLPGRVLKGFGGALLCFNEDKNQLFVEGGNQFLDDANLKAFGITKPHEIETLGKVVGIDYHTTKTHLGDEGGTATYGHVFRTTNENGQHVVVKIARYPDLIYRVRDEQLEFSGGSYEIRAEGIDK
jgi:hypothetical protein